MMSGQGDGPDHPSEPDRPPEGWGPPGGPGQGSPEPGSEPPGGFSQPGYPPIPGQQGEPGYQPPPGHQPPPGQYAGAYGQPVRTGSGSEAGLALGLSLGGLLTALFFGCCFPLSLIGAIVSCSGAYLGTRELAAIDEGRSNPSQRSMAKAAQIIGILTGAVYAMLWVFFVVTVGVGSLTG